MTDTDRSNAGQTAMQPCTHDGIAAQETWRDCTAAHGGRLRLVLLAPDPQSAAPLLEQAARIADTLPVRTDAALRYLWEAGREPADPDAPPDTFLQGFAPSDLVLAADGGYVMHLAPLDDAWFMDGYWPSLQFSAQHEPLGWVCES